MTPDPESPRADAVAWCGQGVPTVEGGYGDSEDVGDLPHTQQRPELCLIGDASRASLWSW